MYQKFSRAQFDKTERRLWFQELAKHIAPQAESRPFVTDLNRLADLPREVRAIYFLWMFGAEVGGNGIECLSLQQQGLFIPQMHEALQLIGAVELVERLEAAIPHAIASEAEFTFGPDISWFRTFRHNPKYSTLQSVDIGIWKLAQEDLFRRCNDFIEDHKDVLVT